MIWITLDTQTDILFEMLGSFSFGDYFKERAIFYAWDFLTNELDIPEDKLWITVHKSDNDAKYLAKKIGIDEKNYLSLIRMITFGAWEMLDHVDHALKFL